MKIFNKFIWSKKEPSNKNDIWFDGSTWRMCTKEEWQSFTLPVDAADKVAKVLENASEVYQEKLNAGYGIVIEGNTISLDVSSIGVNANYNIGSIDLFEQIIVERRNHDLTQEDKDAILSGKIITTSAGNVVVPTISSNSMGENGAVLIFHFNERLYEMFVMWSDTRCYINGIFSFIKETKLYADSELSETSKNSIQNKVVTEKLTELAEEVASNGVLIEDLQNMKIDRENDDYYPKMAVGLADNLAGVDVVDSEFNFRRSGGGAISDGMARIENIKGNSMVWNQQNNPHLTAYTQRWLALNGNYYSVTTEKDSVEWLTISTKREWIEGHYYYFNLNVIGSPTSGFYMEVANNTVNPNTPRIVRLSAASTKAPTLRLEVGNVGVTFSLQAIDLTQMFGAGNEPTTLEEFYERKPLGIDEYAYNEGEVIHMNANNLVSVGVNQWDEQWENGRFASEDGTLVNSATSIRSANYFKVFPNTAYYATYPGAALYMFWYDSEFKYIGNKGLYPGLPQTSPANAAYAKFYTDSTSYNNDICINLSDTSINGKYYPHIKRQEDLSLIRKYFPQGMKSAPTAHDAIRYNKESNKWEKAEAIGIRVYQEGDADNASYLTDGKVTCYPLAEPIITELDEADQFKDLDYAVWNAGTEKAIAEGKSAPLAADITYGFNAIGKIKELESLVAALRAKVGI